MNMMEMAEMEEAIDSAWMEYWAAVYPHRARYPEACPKRSGNFEKGFRAGVAWAVRQAKCSPSSHAVGNISQYPPATEQPEEEV
jgi:hypothetical protein